MPTKNIHIISLLSLTLWLAGCATTTSMVPSVTERAKVGFVTAVHNDLRSLPPPKEKLVVSVYRFRDQTGQFKQSATGGGFSTAVTQGATSMLLKALEETGWFVILEREGLSNLLNERRIIRSTRENFKALGQDNVPPLPPLLYAGIMLEGGIISYETNLVTGGYGVRYFGVGGSNQFRKDQVSIYLRTVATQNGQVLKTINASKSILSQQVQGDLFRFVRLRRLLEVEAGITTNEPPQMAVLEAIEKAVLSLVIEGIVDRSWSLENPEDINAPVILRYLKEKEEDQIAQAELHEKGFPLDENKWENTPGPGERTLSVGVSGSSLLYQGDFDSPQIKPGGELMIQTGINPHLSIALGLGRNRFAAQDRFESSITTTTLKALVDLSPRSRLSAYVGGGGSLFKYKTKNPSGSQLVNSGWRTGLSVDSGITYKLIKKIKLHGGIEHLFMFSDQLDGFERGSRDDRIWGARFGVTYRLY